MREHDARSVGVDSSQSGVTPHRQQAPSRIWPPLPLPSFQSVAPFRRLSAPALPVRVAGSRRRHRPAFIGSPTGVRERDASEGA